MEFYQFFCPPCAIIILVGIIILLDWEGARGSYADHIIEFVTKQGGTAVKAIPDYLGNGSRRYFTVTYSDKSGQRQKDRCQIFRDYKGEIIMYWDNGLPMS